MYAGYSQSPKQTLTPRERNMWLLKDHDLSTGEELHINAPQLTNPGSIPTQHLNSLLGRHYHVIMQLVCSWARPSPHHSRWDAGAKDGNFGELARAEVGWCWWHCILFFFFPLFMGLSRRKGCGGKKIGEGFFFGACGVRFRAGKDVCGEWDWIGDNIDKILL